MLALAGVLTGIAGLVTSQATVWALQAKNGPIFAVASAVRDFTPGSMAHWLISRVGHLDKPLLIGGTGLVVVGVFGFVGTQTRKHPLLGDVVYFAFAAIGLGAVLRLNDSTVGSSLGVVVGLVTWIVVHRLLTAPMLGAETEVSGTDRRAFLQRAGGVSLVVLAVGILGDLSSRGRRRVEEARRLLRLPVGRGTAPAAST
jgi:hypothetical protein